MYQGLQPQGVGQFAQGSTLHVFNRKDFTVTTATVTGVSMPHIPKAAQGNPSLALSGLVMDVSLTMGGESTSIEFPVNSASANYPDKGWFISADSLIVSREIEAAINGARRDLEQVPWKEEIVKRGPALLMQLNPDKKREAQREEEIEMLKKQIESMERKSAESGDKLDQVLALLSKVGPQMQKTKD